MSRHSISKYILKVFGYIYRVINRSSWVICFLCTIVIFSPATLGEGIGKVYSPYVEPLETEIEWFGFFQDADEGSFQRYKLGVGKSLNEKWFAEVYIITGDVDDGQVDVNVVELEAKRQLTEQGEYSQDWGLLFEYEEDLDYSSHEFSTALLIAKDIRRWTTTTNIFAIYEWGSDRTDDLEAAVSSQLRYRYREMFEPGIEIHMADGVQAIGPMFSGIFRVGTARRLRWELGVFADFRDVGSNRTVKAGLEYEF